MNHRIIGFINVFLVFLLISPLFLQIAPDHAFAKANSKSYLVGLKTSKKSVIRAFQTSSVKKIGSRVMIAKMTEQEAEAMLEDPNVEYIEEDVEVELAGLEDAQETSWGMVDIGANESLAKNYVGDDIKVAILDTGIANHPDLEISGGVSYIADEENYEDYHGHGTAIAGIIAGQNNDFGIVGVAPKAKIYAVKVLDKKGHGSYSGIIQGIEWAIQHDMNIISISAGGYLDSQALHDQIKRANDQGILVIAAAGNRGMGEETELYPARYPEAISVGAVDEEHQRADFSSVGSGLDLVAPGVDIVSTSLDDGYEKRSGTSIAVPHIAGAAAVIWSKNKNLKNEEVREILQDTATSLGEERYYGEGLVNLVKALKLDDDGPIQLESLESSETELQLESGASHQLQIKAKYTDNSSKDITSEVSYEIENEQIATINTSGMVTTNEPGSTILSISYEGQKLSIPITVQEKELAPRGELENPKHRELIEGLLEIKGWYMDPAGVSQVIVWIDGQYTGEAFYGDARPDIEAAYPEYKNGTAGFTYQLDTTPMAEGSHTLSIQVINQAGDEKRLGERTFYIGQIPPSSPLEADVSSIELAKGETHQLAITSIFEGESKDVTAEAAYTIENPLLVSVSPTGLVTGLEVGTTSIAVTYGDQSLTIPVTVKEPEPLISQADLDTPSNGATINGVYLVKGWYLDQEGVAKVEVFMDGQLIGEAMYGEPRPDIEKAYPGYMNPNAGFQYQLDTTTMAEGSHVLSVMVTNQKGIQKELTSRTIKIGPEVPIVSLLADVEKLELPQGNTHRLKISAILEDQTARDVTSEAIYSVEDASIASVSTEGIVTGIRPGSTNVSVVYAGIPATIPVVVKAAEHQAQGGLDTPLNGATISGIYPVTGWFYDPSGVDTIEVLVDGVFVGKAEYGDPRPEIEITEIGSMDGNIGFHYLLDTTSFMEGTHTIAIRETGANGNQTLLETRTITIVPLLPATGISADVTALEMVQGKTHQLMIKAILDDQSTRDITEQALYKVEKSGIAKVSLSGQITAVSQGNTNVVVSYGNHTLKIPLTVKEAEPLVARGEMETPRKDVTISGSYPISGWFLDPAGVAAIKVLIDGEVKGEAVYGESRPDISLKFPDYKNSNAGFRYELDTSQLTEGVHTVAIMVTGQDRAEHQLEERTFQVGAPSHASSLASSESPIVITKDTSKQLLITATLEDQSTKEVTAEAIYTVENSTVLHVNPVGLVTGLSVGMTNVTVQYGGQTLTIPVTVKEAGPLVPKGEFEAPLDRSTIGGTAMIKGWFLDPSEVAKIEILVDGEVKGEATYGEARADIAKLYPDYHQENAGFTYLLDTSSMSEGSTHTISIRETGKDGKENILPERTITVGPITGFAVNHSSVEVIKEKTLQFTVTASYRDQSTKEVTTEATYTIQDPTIAKIDTNGLITGLALGSTTLTVSFAGIIQTYPVNVKADGLIVIGDLETPMEDSIISGAYHVTGWFLDPNGVDKVEVFLDEELLGAAEYGIARPDIAHQYRDYKNESAGFTYTLDPKDLNRGNHDLKVTITGKDGQQTSYERNVTFVDPIKDEYIYWLNFSNEQKKDQWSYQELNGSDFENLNWDEETNEWKGRNGETAIGNTWVQVGSSDPVIKWKAPRTGKIHIGGWLSMIDVETGDGVNARVMQNDTQLWPVDGWQTIAFNDAEGVEINQEVEVEEGDEIIFQVNAKENTEGDLVKWTPEIAYLSTDIKDNDAPRVYLSNPIVGQVVSTVDGDDVITISGYAMDPNDEDQVQVMYQLDDEDPIEITRFTSSGENNEFTYHLPIENLEPDHVYTIRVWAFDQKWNLSETAKVDFHLGMEVQERDRPGDNPVYLAPIWISPKDKSDVNRGEKVNIQWKYPTDWGFADKYITSQTIIIKSKVGTQTAKTLATKTLTGTVRSYTFDTNVITENANVTVTVKSEVSGVPSQLTGVVNPGSSNVSFFLVATNKPPVVVSTRMTARSDGLKGKVEYSIEDPDEKDNLVSILVKVGRSPGGNDLLNWSGTYASSVGRTAKGDNFFDLHSDLFGKPIYWNIIAQDSRGGSTVPVNYSVNVNDILPKIVIFTPEAKQTIDVKQSFTLEGTYNNVKAGDVISVEINTMKKQKEFVATGSSGRWSLTWTGSEIGKGTYSGFKVKLNGVVQQTYNGSITVEEKPGKPAILKWETTTNSIKIYWQKADGATNYGITVDQRPMIKVGDISDYVITNLQSAKAYTIFLTPFSSSGASGTPDRITVETKPSPTDFMLLEENTSLRTYFSKAMYFKVIAKSTGTYQVTLNTDSGFPANATISVFREAGLNDADKMASGINSNVNAEFQISKTYFIMVAPKEGSSFYGTLLVKSGGEEIQLNQPKEITLKANESIQYNLTALVPGRYRMVTKLKNATDKYPEIKVTTENGTAVSPKENLSASEIAYELASGKYSIKLTNKDTVNPVSFTFTVFGPNGAGVYEYIYDQNNRLKEIKENGFVSIKYTYDENGNLLRSTKQSVAPTPKATALSLNLSSVDISAGDSKSLKVTATMENGGTQDVTSQVVYLVENPSVATVSNGVIYAVNGGKTNINMSYGGQSKTIAVTVDAPSVRLTSITMSPSSVRLTEGDIQRLYVTARYSNGNEVNVSQDASYQSSNPSVAVVSSQGVITGTGAGTAVISATYNGEKASSQVEVQGTFVREIKVNPANVTLETSGTQQLYSSAIYSNGSVEDVSGKASYSVSNTKIATVSSLGTITALSPGTTQVTITYGGVTTTISVNVSGPVITLQSLAVSPTAVNVKAGEKQQLAVIATYSDGGKLDVTNQATYQVVQADIASVSTSGLVTGMAAGTTAISVTFGGKAASSVSVTVTPAEAIVQSITIVPTTVSVSAGTTQQLTVTATYSDGTTKDVSAQVTYQSAQTNIATVNAGGLVTGVAVGNTTVSVKFGDKTASVAVAVTQATVQNITVAPTHVSVSAGMTQQLTVNATYSDGTTKDVTAQATYQPAQTNIATVSAGGLITGVAAGTTTVSVKFGDKTTSVAVTVTQATVQSIAVAPTNVSVPAGMTQQLTVTATYSDGTTKDVTAQATYQSAQENITTVSAGGLITGVAVGNTTISVKFGDKTVSVPITVIQATVQSIAVAPTNVSVSEGMTYQLTVTATYNDGKTSDITSQVVYQSLDSTIATISTTGLVTGVIAGNTSVRITFGDKSVSVPVVVTAQNIVQNVTVTPQSITLMKQATQQLTVVATMIDGTKKDVTAESTYQSENPELVSVDSKGLVSGGREGSSTITVTYTDKTITVPVKVVNVDIKPNRLAAGGSHTLMVKDDGTVWAWGQNSNSQLGDGTTQNRTTPVESMIEITVQQLVTNPSTVLLPAGQSKALQVIATYANGSTQDVTTQSTYQSDSEFVKVDASGLLTGVATGYATITVTYYDKTISVPVQVTETENKANRLSAGGSHTLMVKEDGTVWAWGQNSSSQLGEGTTQNRTTPVESMLVISVQQLVATPNTVLLPTSQSKPLKITATYANNSTQDITSQSTYVSSDPTIATVDESGQITGVAKGTTTITVTYYDKAISVPVQVTATENVANRLSAGGSHTLMVKEDGTVWAWGQNSSSQLGEGTTQNRTTPVESMLVISVQQLVATPNTVLLPTSQSKPLKITATYANNSMQDVTSQSTYVSSDPTIATVDATGQITGVAKGTATITVTYYDKTISVPVQVTATENKANRLSAGGSHTLMVKEDGTAWAWGQNNSSQLGDGTTQNRSTPVESMLVISVQQLVATPSPVLLPTSQSKPLKITATFANNSTQDVTSQSTYVSSDPTIATVDATGQITGVAKGTATITVTYYDKTISVPVQVTATENKANRLSAGGSHTLMVKEDGTAWAWGQNSSSQLGDGTTQNRSTPVESMLVISVQQLVATPSPVLLPTSQSKPLKIMATFANNSTQDVTSQSTYVSSVPAIAKVDASGVITGVATGTVTITVTYYEKTISVPVQIVATENKANRLSAGGSHTLMVKEDGTAWAWGQNNSSQLGDGTTQNRTTPVESMLVISVQQLVATPSPVLLPTAQSKPLKITATYANNSTQDVTSQSTYVSSDPAIAKVDASGVITGVATGTVTITVTYYEKTISVPVHIVATENKANRLSAGGSHTLMVKEDGTAWAWGQNNSSQLGDGTTQNRTTPVESMLVILVQQLVATPSPVLLPTAQSKPLKITATYANNSTQDVTSQSTYVSSDPAIAKVDATGVITGVATGTVTITVTYYEKTISVPVQIVATENKANRLSAGGSHTLMVKEDGTAWAWGQNNSSQLGDGTTQNRTTPVESMLVISVQQLVATPNTVLLPTAQSKPLKITATYANNSTQDVTSQSTYVSSDPAIAKVDATGVITGVATGTVTITVTYYEKTISVPVQIVATENKANRLSAGGSHTLMVKEDGTAWAWGQNNSSQLGDGTTQNRTTPVESMLVISVQQLVATPNTVLLPTAQSKPLKITATYANNSTQDVTSQSTYQSSDPTIAKIDASGVITGVATGSATITVTYYEKTISIPVQVVKVENKASTLSAGGSHTLMIKNNGTTWAMGLNSSSQLGNGSTQNSLIPIQASGQ